MAEALRFEVIVDTSKGTASIKQFGQQVKESTDSISKMGSALEVIKWGTIISMAEKALATFKKFFELAELGATVKSIEDSFALMSQNVGISADVLIRKLKEVTASTVDDSDLMRKATRLMSEGFDYDQIVKIGEAARVGARLMGTEVSAAYDAIGDSIVNLRVRGLKAQGFVIDLDKAYLKHATSLGIDKDMLSDYGKQMALTNAVYERTLELQTQLKVTTETASEKIQAQKAQWNELKENIGKAALALLEFLDIYNTMKRMERVPEIMGKGPTKEMQGWIDAAILYERAYGIEQMADESRKSQIKEADQIAVQKRLNELTMEGYRIGNLTYEDERKLIILKKENALAENKKLLSSEVNAKIIENSSRELEAAYTKEQQRLLAISEVTLKMESINANLTNDYEKQVALLQKQYNIQVEQLALAVKAKALTVPQATTQQKELKTTLDLATAELPFKTLGIQSEATLKNIATAAVTAMSAVRAQFEQGKASVSDYVNALRAAKKAMDDLAGPDTLQSEYEAGEAWSKQMKGINKDEADWRKQESTYTDEYIKKMDEINKLKKPTAADIPKVLDELRQVDERLKAMGITIKEKPLTPEVDTSKVTTAFKGIDSAFNDLKSKIETPINMQVNSSGMLSGGGGGYTSTAVGTPPVGQYGGAWDANLKNKLATIPANVEFTASGLSPTIPLGEAFTKVEGKVASIGEQMGAMNFAVSFTGGGAITQATKDIQKLTGVYNNWMWLISMPGGRSISTMMVGMGKENMDKIGRQFNDALGDMFNSGLANLNNFLNSTGKELTESLWYRFIQGPMESSGVPSQYLSNFIAPISYKDVATNFASWQGGGVVPKTGLHMLHEGERVVPKNSSINMGGVTIQIGGGSAKEQAQAVIRELQKQLKYKQVELN
jgi:hypothetical protein